MSTDDAVQGTSHIERTMRDGSTVRATREAMATVIAVENRLHREEQSMGARLKARGVIAWHPDDGWVRRDPDDPSVHLEYPTFRLKTPEPGDLIALSGIRETRIVRVNRAEACSRVDPGHVHYHFDPEPVEVWGAKRYGEPQVPKRTGLRRFLTREDSR
jgi:hypothetical protein